MTLLLKVKSLFNGDQNNKAGFCGEQNLFQNLKGATAIEYALLLAMVGLLIILGLSQMGASTQNIIQLATDVFNDASPST